MRKLLILGALTGLTLTHLALAGPVEPYGGEAGFRNVVLQPFATQLVPLKCKAKERTAVIVYGQGSSPMAIYVFDAAGNCVARDDLSQGPVSDDLAVEWYPPTLDVYDIELRNLGQKTNRSEVAIR